MSIDEFAEMEGTTDNAVMKINGIWWHQVRPFFYRTLLPFETYNPNQTKLCFGRFTTYQHAISDNQPHNSYLNLIIFDQLQNYSIMNLCSNNRKKVRRALKNNLKISRITDFTEFIEKAYPVYTSFYDRTKYAFKKNRIKKEKFTQWGQALFRYPKVMVLGVFVEDKLVSVEISCLVKDVLILKSSINSKTSLKLHASDLMLHFYRENAAKQPDIKMICAGILLQKEGINNFKIERGARVIALSSYLHIHPVLLWSLKKLRKNIYRHLKGMNEEQLRERISSIQL